MKTACFTIVSNNYLHFAKTMLDSFNASNPNWDCYCVLVDENTDYAAEIFGRERIISMAELNIAELRYFQFKYSILELNTAVKPWAFRKLIDKDYRRIIYLDPDIYVYNKLSEVSAAFDAGANIVLTPHLTQPILDNFRPNELDIRKSGTYNLGFCAISNSSESIKFIEWWKEKLSNDCVVDLENGIFVDQSWIDLVPGMYCGVSILRHEGYNAAYWNVVHREISVGDDGQYFSNKVPLVFFHFSGFDPFNPVRFSKHQNRYQLTETGLVEILCMRYAEKLFENGAKKYSALKYAYGQFRDGISIQSSMRKFARNTSKFSERKPGDPFKSIDWFIEFYFSEPELNSDHFVDLLEKYITLDRGATIHLSKLQTVSEVLNKYKIDIEREFGIDSSLKLRDAVNKKITTHNNKSNISARRVVFLYKTILNRLPDESGYLEYSNKCSSLAGYFKTWYMLLESAESKEISCMKTRFYLSFPLFNLNPEIINKIGNAYD